jgi:hypothetical protein
MRREVRAENVIDLPLCASSASVYPARGHTRGHPEGHLFSSICCFDDKLLAVHAKYCR